MNKILLALPLLFSFSSFADCGQKKFALVIHGGVGYNANEKQKAVMVDILKKGHEALKGGAIAQDVVQSSVEAMEDSGLFNAGKGGTRTNKGTVELDASIMDGKTMAAGAVGSVKDVKNPIRLARMVKDKTKHVFMVGEGASAKAKEFGLEMVSSDYFVSQAPMMTKERFHYGTVGAVALDRCGDLAAATSTGGLFGKNPGRLGDSPVIGAGTYANNKTVAVSCTGEGEKFIRATAGARISMILEYTKRNLKSAVEETLTLVKTLGGDGGIITVDKNGQVVTSTNDNMPMPRGYVRENGTVVQND
ncbi:MAG: isoaspartyl peptidase/L-asparaginase [Bdellovibrionota bacterium]